MRLQFPRLAVFGGSGFVGTHLLEAALNRGYAIKVLVRTPDKLAGLRSQVEVVQGDLFDPQAIARTLQGCQALVSCAGPTLKKSSAWTQAEFTQAMTDTVKALREQQIRRFLVLASAGTRMPGWERGWRAHCVQLMMRTFFPTMIHTKEAEMAILRQTDLDWTILRPPLIRDNENPTPVLLQKDALPGFRISVTSLVNSMLDELEEQKWLRQAPFCY